MLLLLALACTPEPPPAPPPVEDPRPDVLLVTIDTLRADRVGAYGDPLAKTPVLDGLAAQGVLFREAHTVTPLTLPAHASILTGRHPLRHGLRDNGGFRLEDGVPTLAAALQGAGYATGAFVSAFVLDGAWGLDRGFDTYRDPFHPQKVAEVGAFGEVELPSAEVVNAAVAWWKQHADGPRFAWVHLYDPHTPWRAHPGWEGDPYRGEVAYADGLLGRLVDLAESDDLVIVTSDHGEGLWDHGEREHGVLLGRGVTRVPLVVRPPGKLAPGPRPAARPTPAAVDRRPAGVDPALALDPVPDAPTARRVVDGTVSAVDLAPTIADYAGVVLPDPDGRSLRPLLEGGTDAPRTAYAETFFPLFHYGWSALQMATDGASRLEVGAEARTTDLATDPAGAHPRTGAPDPALQAVLDRWRGEGTPQPGPIPGDAAAALEALGYLTAAAPTEGELPDPRDQIGLLAELHAAEVAPEAVGRLRALVQRQPDMVDARIALSLALADQGDLQGALAETRAVLDRWPDHPTALSNGGFLARTLGDPELALELARRMRALNPQDPRGYRLEAAVLVDREDAPALLEVCRAGVAVAPEDPNLHYLLALAEIEAGDPLAGVPHLQAAREHGTEAKDVDLWLGVAFQRGGKLAQAKQAYEAATRTMPSDPRPWAMAGVMLWQAGACAEAKPFLVNVARRGGGNDPQIRRALGECEAKLKAERAEAKAARGP